MFRKTIAILATGIAALMMTGLAHARDQIQIVGSSAVYPFATVVAEKHGQRVSMKTPVIESTGTGGRMKLFCNGLDPSTQTSQMLHVQSKAAKKNYVRRMV